MIALFAILALALIVPALIYVPLIQDFAKDIALREVKKSTGMDISVDYLRLRFPLKVELNGVKVLEESGDTMASLGSARVGVRLFPLFCGDIDASGLDIDNLSYRLGTPDSATYLLARIDRFTLDDADYSISTSDIDLSKAILDGGFVSIVLKDTVIPDKPDTVSSPTFAISVDDIQIRNLRVKLQMLPDIDSLGVNLPSVSLSGAFVDLANQKIRARSLSLDSLSATYLTPSIAWLRQHPVSDADTGTVVKSLPSNPWTVEVMSLNLSAQSAIYAMRGVKPSPGFDFGFIQVSDVEIAVDSLFNRGSAIRVPLRRLNGRERCGLMLEANGMFVMDSAAMAIDNVLLSVGSSQLRADASMAVSTPLTDPSTPVSLRADGRISLLDIETAFPSMAKTFRGLPRRDITLGADIDGTMGRIDIHRILFDWPSYIRLTADGELSNPADFNRMNGKVNIGGSLSNVNFLKPTFLSAAMARQVNIPLSLIKGSIVYRPRKISGKLAVITGDGRIALDGRWNGGSTDYYASMLISSLPVQNFMPSLGISDLSCSLNIEGHGYNPLSSRTSIDANFDLSSVIVNAKTYSDISINASLVGGVADGNIISHNPGADLDAVFKATFSPDEYTWDISGDIRELDLSTLGVSKQTMNGSLSIATVGAYSPRTDDIDASFSIDNLYWQMEKSKISIPKLSADFAASDTITDLYIDSGDLHLAINAYSGINPILKQMSTLPSFIDSQIQRKALDVVALQSRIPPLDASLTLGHDNPVATYLAQQKISFNSVNLTASNDSLIAASASVLGFAKDKFRLDSISVSLMQHLKYLVYSLKINNRPGTLDNFAHVALKGYLADDKASILIDQRNIAGRQGFHIGMNAAFTDTIVSLKFVPYRPTIAYQRWTLNHDNSLSYNFLNKNITANLSLNNDKSLVKIFTKPSLFAAADTAGGLSNDVAVQLSNIHLADWLSISPFAPPIKGDLGADLTIEYHNKQLMGNGIVSLTDLYYGRDRVGTFDLDLKASNDKSGALHADVALMIDSVKVITATGALNDSTSANPFLLDFSMIRFPLAVVNPFLPKNVAQMKGMLNGAMKITGSMANPVFNGSLDFDSAAVKVGLTGESYAFSDEKIPVDSNIVRFSEFKIHALNDNPLAINGTVDMRHFSNIAVDLSMKANDMLVVNTSRPRGANIYGKAYLDLDATANGNLEFLNVDASLVVLPETNVTYVLTASQQALSSKSAGNMVQFVQFNDTVAIDADTIQKSPMSLELDARLDIREGSTINVDISSDGKNKASIKGFGVLDYDLNPMNDGRLVGRFTINSGFVRYSPPLMSEKNFKFSEGSYVSFSGNILNPTLSIRAVDEMKANVTREGQNSRLVNFLVELSVTQSLQNMNVAFDLSTNDDITVENELESMSPEQRANQAMNLLLYNVYTGPGTKGSANLSGNPLFSFLESQINSWAANNIKFVDIAFGIDQYDKTTDGSSQTTTSYSYRVSKTLFNNRFKIVVGGNYSTDADADENFSQNLINDISFEYMLNRSGSMFVRLFRHVGYESILEGEVTQTGVGFVYRRKLDSLRDLFHWVRHKRSTIQPSTK